MKQTTWLIGLAAGLLSIGCSDLAGTRGAKASVGDTDRPAANAQAGDEDDIEEEDEDDDEQEIALAHVPALVKQAALAAVPGLVLTEASTESEHGVTLYKLEGTANGTEYEVEVTADGTVKEVETENGDEEHEDEDDD